jgi:hypothetical protein
MLKRGSMKCELVLLFLITIILITTVYAADGPPPGNIEEPGGGQTETGSPAINKLLQGNSQGELEVSEQTLFNTGKYGGTVDAGTVTRGEKQSQFENLVEVRGGGMYMTNGKDVTIEDNGDYSAASVGMVDQGAIILSNAVNVRWENGVMTAGSAANLDYKGSTSTDIVMLVADGKEFSVESASAVQAGCFLVEDVNNAQFVVGRNVTMTTSGTGKVVYDQGTKIDYTAKQLNSSLSGSIIACRRPTYQVKAMELNTRTGNFSELVNGSGEIQLDGRYGVVCLNLTPVSTYDIDTGRFEDSFGFIIKEYAYKLCVQKAVAQKLVADCPLCGLVDLANNFITLNGVIEYTRYVFDSALIDANKRTAFKSLGFGKNIIDLAKGEVIISKDEPEINTVLSNYLELKEIKEGASTHRFLGINEKIDRVSKNWANIYSTSYSNSATTIIDNLLDYRRQACRIVVLPPDSPLIPAILSSINEQKVLW